MHSSREPAQPVSQPETDRQATETNVSQCEQRGLPYKDLGELSEHWQQPRCCQCSGRVRTGVEDKWDPGQLLSAFWLPCPRALQQLSLLLCPGAGGGPPTPAPPPQLHSLSTPVSIKSVQTQCRPNPTLLAPLSSPEYPQPELTWCR